MRVALFLSWQRSASARSLRFRAVKAKFRLHSWVTCHASFTVILRDLGQSAGFRVKHAATKGAKKAPCRLLRLHLLNTWAYVPRRSPCRPLRAPEASELPMGHDGRPSSP